MKVAHIEVVVHGTEEGLGMGQKTGGTFYPDQVGYGALGGAGRADYGYGADLSPASEARMTDREQEGDHVIQLPPRGYCADCVQVADRKHGIVLEHQYEVIRTFGDSSPRVAVCQEAANLASDHWVAVSSDPAEFVIAW